MSAASPAGSTADRPGDSADGVVVARVWDLPVRLLHWTIAIAVVTAWALGEWGPFLKTWHFYAGYTVGVLVALRLVWGVVGSQTARFAAMLRGPGAVARYAAHVGARKPSHWYGHNPLGALSAIAILAVLAVQVATGLMADDEIANAGPLASMVGSDVSATATALHANLSRVLLALVVLHVSAIAYYAVWKRENLVGAMITGRRAVRQDQVSDVT